MSENTKEYCSVCGRDSETAGPMVHMPGGINMCPSCMQRAMDDMNRFSANMDPNVLASMMNFGNPNASASASNSANDNFKEVDTDAEKSGDNIPVTVEPSDVDIVDNGEDAGENSDHSANQGNNNQNNQNQSMADMIRNLFGGGDQNGDVTFLNLGDMFGGMNGMPGGPKVKKRPKPGAKTQEAEANAANEDDYPLIDINNIPAPHKIKEMLDQYVIGQDQAKKYMSVAVYNHYKRIAFEQENEQSFGTAEDLEGVNIEKSNMLMIGPTGSGKTYLVRTLARILDVPLAITDATSLTEAGYIGDDIESVISKLLAAADNDVDRAEQGIVFIDEIDKLAKKTNSHSRDVSGEAVQQGMLKLLEGSEIEVPVGASSKNMMAPMVTVNTKNILFICGGAFPGLEDIIKERLNKKTLMGFTSDLKDQYDKDKNILSRVRTEDLRAFGMIPEFLGRLPIVTAFQALDEDMLVRILREPKNAIIKQYQKLLALDEVELTFDDDALRAIARKATEEDLGARALRSIIEEYMMDIMYEIPKDPEIGSVAITEDYIEHKGGPRVSMRSVERIAENN